MAGCLLIVKLIKITYSLFLLIRNCVYLVCRVFCYCPEKTASESLEKLFPKLYVDTFGFHLWQNWLLLLSKLLQTLAIMKCDVAIVSEVLLALCFSPCACYYKQILRACMLSGWILNRMKK